MKDSGIDWIGKIPEEWIVSKAKTILHNKTVKNHPNAEVLSLYRDLGVVPKNSRDDNHNVTSEDTSSYKFVQKGELVLNKMKTWQGSLAVSNYEGIVSPAYYVCEFTNNEIDKNYIHYLLRNKMYAQEFERLSTGLRVGQWDLSIDDFLNTLIIYPPTKAEQTKIANFLDKKCAQIDSIIEESKKSIEEYKSWKQSVIFEAVTGKNLSCKKKDSGIEWLGEIPEEWEVCKLKYLLKTNLQYGANSSGIEFNENLPRYVRITDIKSSEALYEKGKLSLSEEDSIGYLLQDGDILFARSGATVGKTFLYHSNIGKAAFAGYLIRAQLNENLNPKFLSYYTLSSGYDEWKNRIFIQATIQNIGADKYANMEIPLPPISEQKSIAKFLDAKCTQIDSLISEKQSLIKDLAEYKKSLIFEAVTGKRRV